MDEQDTKIHMYCLDVDYQLSSQSLVNADCADWDMSNEWKMEEYPKTSCKKT